MKMLMAMMPTVFFVVYSQLVTKWRVEVLMGGMAGAPDGASRLLVYLKDPLIVSAYVASFLASIAWMFVVEKFDISNAFPIYIGLIVLLVTLGGAFFFREMLSFQRVLAISLIILGVVIGSKS